MIKRKCSGCAKRIERSFNFCPWCGEGIKGSREESNFGLLGRNDNTIGQNQNMQGNFNALPFGLDKMVGPLIKQLERELSNMDKQNPNLKT